MKSIFFILSLLVLGYTNLTAQSFTGKVMKTTKPPVPFYQANVEIKNGDKTVKVLKTYFDGTFAFNPDRNQTYSVKISSPGYIDSTIIFTTNKKAAPTPSGITLVLKKDGMRLYGQVRNKKENFPLKGVTLVLKNIMTRKTQRITTDVDGQFNFKIELENNYSFTVDKHSPGVANKYKDTTMYITTLGMTKPIDLKLNLFLPSRKPIPVSKHKSAQPNPAAQAGLLDMRQAKKHSKSKPEKEKTAIAKDTVATKTALAKQDKKIKEAPPDIVVIRDNPTPAPVKPNTPIDTLKVKAEEKKPEKLSKKALAARQKFVEDSIANATAIAKQQAIQDSINSVKLAEEKAERELAKKAKEDSIIKANIAALQRKLIQDSLAVVAANREKDLAAKKLREDSIAKINVAALQKKLLEDSISAIKAKAEKQKADKELAAKKFHEDSIAKVAFVALQKKLLQDSIAEVKAKHAKEKAEKELVAKKMREDSIAKVTLATQQKKLIQDSIAAVKAKVAKEKADKELAAKKLHEDSIIKVAVLAHQKKLAEDSLKAVKSAKERIEKELAAKKIHEDSIVKATLIAQRKKFVQDSVAAVKAKAAKEKTERELAAKKLREDSVINANLIAREKKLMHDSITVANANKVLAVTISAENTPVFFSKNSFAIPDSAQKQLEDIAHQLATNPSWNLNLHSLASADETNPEHLLLKRSNAVIEYLLKAGIPLKQIQPLYSTVGKSRNGCITPSCPEEQLRQNRCVVYEIIKK